MKTPTAARARERRDLFGMPTGPRPGTARHPASPIRLPGGLGREEDHRSAFMLPRQKRSCSRAATCPASAAELEMKKAENGVWEATIGPGRFRRLPLQFQRRRSRGDRSQEPDDQRVEHEHLEPRLCTGLRRLGHQGRAPRRASRRSLTSPKLSKRPRRMHVYTPPGYEKGEAQVSGLLPPPRSIRLLTQSWSTVGRAGFILDNLIAAGKAKPMIVVMPAGHTGAFRFGPPGGDSFERKMDEFVEDFTKDCETVRRVELSRQGRPGQPRDRRPVDGRSANAQHRVRPSRRFRLYRCLQLGNLRHRRWLRRRGAEQRNGKTATRPRSMTPS